MPITRRTFLCAGVPLCATPKAVQDDWQGIGRVVAVGDVHGDCDALAAVLKMAGLLDGKRHWIGSQAHLVQIGDIPARGPQSRLAFDLLMRIEREALNAGGRVHALIGNHDAGVMYGDLRSILPEEYLEFRGPESEQLLSEAFSKEMANLRQMGRLPSKPSELEYLKKTWFERHAPGFVEHRMAFGPSGQYGSWIRKNNAIVRINDTLYVHGGISPEYARQSCSQLNAAIRRELAAPHNLPPGLATDIRGPLWYRGFAEGEESGLETHLAAVLKFHGVSRIVVGHTVTKTAILPRFGSRIVNIDLGLSRFYGRPPACLVQEKGESYVIHRGARIALPGPKPEHFIDYLRSVVAADVQPSPVERLLLAAGQLG